MLGRACACTRSSARVSETALETTRCIFDVASARRQFATSGRQDERSLEDRNIAVKDNIVTTDLPTTASSCILNGHNSPFEATVVRLLKEHGANICCKTNLDEFGMGSHNQNVANGTTVSPFTRAGKALSPGGSSGGSAVAVATNKCWAALGTDTGGSVRLPAAYTGIVGFKPSYGMLSRWGVIQYANSLDTVGILTRDIGACRQVFAALKMYDAQDPSSLSNSVRVRLAKTHSSKSKLRIGVPKEYITAEVTEPVRSAWAASLNAMQATGHEIVELSLPTTQKALSAYYILAPAEASSNLAKYDGIRYGRRSSFLQPQSDAKLPLYARTRGGGLGEEVKRRILLGAYTLSSTAIDNYFIQAQKLRRLVQDDFNKVFALANPLLDDHSPHDAGVDFLIVPTAPTLPPTIEQVKQQSPLEKYMNDVFTVPASLAGLPAISVPIPIANQEEDVQSIGMQVIGQFGNDDAVLNAAEQLMQSI